ncbi:MAG TPA: hypothetical protein VHE12_01405 [bacterium]|nr:hypothetical protein [bacterium]
MDALQKMKTENKFDENGVPSGGTVRGIGLTVTWQEGPLGRPEARKEQNGALVEDLLQVCLDRLKLFQDTRFNCPENVLAASSIEEALKWLQKRTEDREKRLVDGTFEV